jgi:hypothetical protein
VSPPASSAWAEAHGLQEHGRIRCGDPRTAQLRDRARPGRRAATADGSGVPAPRRSVRT